MNEVVAVDKLAILDSAIFGYPLLVFLSSLFVYWNAHRIVRNSGIFYFGGAVLGIFASLIGVAYMLQKLIPRRALAIPVWYLGGWPISAYMYYQAYKNIGNIARNYPTYLFSYISVCMLVSFAICYRIGPPSDPRTINLMKWFLQLCSFAGIYWSNPYKPIAVAFITILATYRFWLDVFTNTRYAATQIRKIVREFIHGPDPRRLLTEQEYIEEADVYTKAELDQLRQFCTNSPSKSNWKLVQNLHDPHRMASFITGDSDHVTQVESREHSKICWPAREEEDGYITDDIDDNDD